MDAYCNSIVFLVVLMEVEEVMFNSSLIGGAFLTNGIGNSGSMSQSYLNGGAGANNSFISDTGFGGGFGGC